MAGSLEPQKSKSVVRSATAGAILVVAVLVALKLAVGFLAGVLSFIFWVVIAVAIGGTILWALRNI